MPDRQDPARRAGGSGDAGEHPDSIRLHIVTGKGGTGKTTVAAVLALALATGGRRVLLMEVEGRQGISQVFGVPALGETEEQVAQAPGGGQVHGLSVEPKAALLEYLRIFYRMGRAGKLLERLGAVDFATTVAPGLRDVLLTGKVYEAVRRRTPDGTPAYDAVVLDAPPTGRIVRFLNVNEEVAGLAKVGPIRSQANSIMTVLRSPTTAVQLVTILEEMPVQETVDAVAELRAAKLPVGALVVNLVRDPVLDADTLDLAVQGRLDRDEVFAAISAAGLGGRGSTRDSRLATLTDTLLDEAREHGQRVGLEAGQRRAVDALGLPIYELPALPAGVDPGLLYELADLLREQGLV